MSTIWSFDSIKNKHNLHRGENCMKKLYFSERTCSRCNLYWKEKNANRNRAKIPSRFDCMLHL